MALDLIRDAEGVLGVTRSRWRRRAAHPAGQGGAARTGGAGRIFAASTNAFINTGDGLAWRRAPGIPLEDMEFWQFHPTGVAGAGVLLTEGCAARARSCATATASASWSATRRPEGPRRRATSSRAAWTRRSRKGAVAVRRRTTSSST
jgi:succinate dehydrogenase/fumarate reductase flavoprotein subunit